MSWPDEAKPLCQGRVGLTEANHYAKRRSGWGSDAKRVARPSAEDVEKVIRSPKRSRDDNLTYLANKRAEEATIPSFRI